MNPVETLLRASKHRIALKENFCQGPFATDENGEEVDELSSKAVCFCAAGALRRSAKDLGIRDRRAASDILSRNAPHGTDYVLVSDCKGHDAIHDLFDKAIKEAAELGI